MALTKNAAIALHNAMMTKWCPEKPCRATFVNFRAPGIESPQALSALSDACQIESANRNSAA